MKEYCLHCGWLREIDASGLCAECRKMTDDFAKTASEIFGGGQLVDVTAQTRKAVEEYRRMHRVRP